MLLSCYPQLNLFTHKEASETLYTYTCVKLTFHLADHSLRFYVPEPIERSFMFKFLLFSLSLAVSEFMIPRSYSISLFAISSHLLNNIGLPQDSCIDLTNILANFLSLASLSIFFFSYMGIVRDNGLCCDKKFTAMKILYFVKQNL